MDELTKLREELDAANRAYACVMQTNVYGMSVAARVKLDISAERVKREWLAAYGRYQNALDAASKPEPASTQP